MMWKVYLFFTAIHLVLLTNLCWSNDANSIRPSRVRSQPINLLQNILDGNDIKENQILPVEKNNCVREIKGEVILSKEQIREDIDENIKKAIKAALNENKESVNFCVSLKIDTDMLFNDSLKIDSNEISVNIYASLDLGRTELKPVVVVNEQAKDWQGHYINQYVLYKLPVNARMLLLSANNVVLVNFSFLGILKPQLLEQNDIFPKIHPIRPVNALRWITAYAKNRNLKPLAKNHMRYFLQPNGIVSQCIDVNLVSGEVLSYPGTHDTSVIMNITIRSKELEDILAILKSKEFIKVPQNNNLVGTDGCSVLIEVDIDGSYLWKSHWSTKDMNYINTMNKIGAILKPYGIDFGIPVPQNASMN